MRKPAGIGSEDAASSQQPPRTLFLNWDDDYLELITPLSKQRAHRLAHTTRTVRKFLLRVWHWIPQARSAPRSGIGPAWRLQLCTPLPAPPVPPAAALPLSLSVPHCSIAQHWAPGPSPGLQGCRHTSPCILVPRQSSSHSPAHDRLCKRFALPDQVTWPKVSHMMGCREIEKPELLWFHLSQVKHLNQQHFYASEAWGPALFDHPSEKMQ